MLNKLTKTTKNRQRVGRGIAAGRGKTAGRGTKGQKSRSGKGMPARFEGGQTPLFSRLPKVKGKAIRPKTDTVALNLDQIDKKFKENEKIDVATLKKYGFIKHNKQVRIKILSRGELKKKIDFSNCSMSKNAAKKIKSTQKK